MSAALAVRDILLRKPSLINGRRAALRVLSEREKCSVSQAAELLDHLKRSNVYVRLFKAVMPEEFKKDPGSRAGIRDRFLAALGFPISEWVIDRAEGTGDEMLDDGIPFVGLSGHICDNCFDFVAMPLDFQLAITIFRHYSYWDFDHDFEDEDQQAYKERLQLQWSYFAKAYQLPAALEPGKNRAKLEHLEAAFQKLRTPLRFLPLLNRTIDYNTGCIFLDFDPNEEFDGEMDWTTQNIAFLRKEYARAQQIEADLYKLGKWLEQEPRARIIQACRLYQKVNDEGNRRKAPKGKPLVRIL